MHMRGTPRTMQSPENTTYKCVWREVGEELQKSAERAVAAGIPAWNIILDPGETSSLMHCVAIRVVGQPSCQQPRRYKGGRRSPE